MNYGQGRYATALDDRLQFQSNEDWLVNVSPLGQVGAEIPTPQCVAYTSISLYRRCTVQGCSEAPCPSVPALAPV